MHAFVGMLLIPVVGLKLGPPPLLLCALVAPVVVVSTVVLFAAGVALATLTLPAADRLQDSVSAHVGIDAH